MSKEKDLAVFVATYETVDSAKEDLDAIELLHKEDLIGTFDAAVVEKHDGKLHVAKRMARPMVHVIPDELGFGALGHKDLKELADDLSDKDVALIWIGEVTLEKAFDRVVTHAVRTAKHVINSTLDELEQAMKEAAQG